MGDTPKPIPDNCSKPPAGWRCTRGAGHDGPCAAVAVDTPKPIPDNTGCLLVIWISAIVAFLAFMAIVTGGK